MSKKDDFVHQLGNLVATAKMSVQIGIELAKEASPPHEEQAQILEKALSALNGITQLVDFHRNELAAKPPSS